MAVYRRTRHEHDDDGQASTRTLGVLVAVMVVAGVVALFLTLFGNDKSSNSATAGQPSGSQVGNQTTTSQSTGAAPTTSAVPSATGASGTTAPSTTTAPNTTAPSTTAPSTTAAAKPKPKPATSAKASTKVVKYTVKKGDNLTAIAGWFNQRGYGLVYNWNKSVIGKNPNLIYPGQTIIVSLTGKKMSVSTKNK